MSSGFFHDIIFYIMDDKKEKKHISSYLKTVLIMTAAIIILSLPALSSDFCDWYNDNIYGILCDAISHVTALFPFAVGEIMMYIGALMLVAAVIMLPLLIFLHKKTGYRRFCGTYFKTLSIVLLSVILVYIPTWFIPFNGSILGWGNPGLRTEYSLDEVRALVQYCADGANAAAEEIYIAEDGTVEFYSPEKISEMAADAMRDLGSEFGRLKGYYPPVKVAICSDILDRMNIGGYNYPFTMEPTHNRYVSPLFQALLDSHEYAHHKGYYQENEANLLSELALTKSDDPYLRLAGYYEMYEYLYFELIDNETVVLDQMIATGEVTYPEKINSKETAREAMRIWEEIFGPEPELSDRVYYIHEAGQQVEQQIYEEDEHVIDDMPAVDELISDTASQGWKIQGDIIQENTYSGVVLLLLQYFYENK